MFTVLLPPDINPITVDKYTMLYGVDVALCSGINRKQINTEWAECTILKC